MSALLTSSEHAVLLATPPGALLTSSLHARLLSLPTLGPPQVCFDGVHQVARSFIGTKATSLTFSGAHGIQKTIIGRKATQVTIEGKHQTEITFVGRHDPPPQEEPLRLQFEGRHQVSQSFDGLRPSVTIGGSRKAITIEGRKTTQLTFEGRRTTQLTFIGRRVRGGTECP